MIEDKIQFTYREIKITIGRYLHYNNFYYEYHIHDGHYGHRCSLHIDMTFSPIGDAVTSGIRSVDDYFNGDPHKTTGT